MRTATRRAVGTLAGLAVVAILVSHPSAQRQKSLALQLRAAIANPLRPHRAAIVRRQIQNFPEPRSASQDSSRKPFTFTVAPRTWSFTPELLRMWMSASVRHAAGANDDQVRLVAGWNETECAREFLDLRDALNALSASSGGGRLTAIDLRGWAGSASALCELLSVTREDAARRDFTPVLARTAMLHTDIAVSESLALAAADRQGFAPKASLHFGVAMALVDELRLRDRQSRLPREWYIAVGAFLQAHRDIASGGLFLNRALSFFPNDSQLSTMSGALNEFLASSAVQDTLGFRYDPRFRSVRFDDERGCLRTARADFRRAIDADPSNAEARVRLGHVVIRLGDYQQALSILAPGVDARTEPRLRYYAWVFNGQAHESLGHLEEARNAYRQAQALFPEAASARIALAAVAWRGGEQPEAAAVVSGALSTARRTASDPWDEYYDTEPGLRMVTLLNEWRQHAGERSTR
jgi:tetratricopeptide (TPR) repeat protein